VTIQKADVVWYGVITCLGVEVILRLNDKDWILLNIE